MFRDAYRGRKVLITGHTGFKGSWMAEWLLGLGAKVAGYSLAPNTSPSHFDLLGLQDRLEHVVGDVRDGQALERTVLEFQPEIIFHLAAQPLVRLSYAQPAMTWETNVMGTVNLLEAVRKSPSVKACVVVTSDKCYENREWPWGYRETEAMGGHDPYSASKGAAELVVASYRRSFFKDPSGCRLASGRAGNVIGGGDWSADRIVTDFVRSILADKPLSLRNPKATRPWQHVLEPLSGYLDLGSRLLADGGAGFADGWNFGPSEDSVVLVQDLARLLVGAWNRGEVVVDTTGNHPHEAGLLKLDCSKARQELGWHGVWGVQETVRRVVAWYKEHSEGGDMVLRTREQIQSYGDEARRQKLPWATEEKA
ncbi:MAG TPA: CDP-glucose 4,6-dehydratase [Fibrobacteria bacterium]|nr:CDP-glucose 4,6-dehydratase [Fibrobacteria bacterium]HOX49934.1 CDP-glucose 4,6-dehydratase [Fibrobacteria bacterium]